MSDNSPAVRAVAGWQAWCRVAAAAVSLAVVGWAAPVAAADVAAGRSITNIASLHYEAEGVERTVESNPATLAVAERLDLTLARANRGPVTLVAAAVTAVPFVLTNTGNGNEAFRLEATLAAGDSRVRLLAIDTDGDGLFDPAKDETLTDNRTPSLAAGASRRLLVVIDTPDAATAGSLTLSARAVTGSGEPGTTTAGQGDDGSDAVVGSTGAAATVSLPLTIAKPVSAPTLVKSQSVLAPDGSANAVRGAVITYTLVAQFPGEAAAATVTDPIPAGTAYALGSLMLDGRVLSDAADDDPGRVTAADGVTVSLGTVTGPATHTIRFNVIIQ
jgi:uncharacterized repeat protein (TIGR01451 family)